VSGIGRGPLSCCPLALPPTKNPNAARGRMLGQIAPSYVAVDANTLSTGATVGRFGVQTTRSAGSRF